MGGEKINQDEVQNTITCPISRCLQIRLTGLGFIATEVKENTESYLTKSVFRFLVVLISLCQFPRVL